MVIMVLLNYSKYIQERFSFRTYSLLAFSLWLIISYSGELGMNLILPPLLFLSLFNFRLVDDLTDIRNDRINFPKRLLAKLESLTPFVVLSVLIHALITLALYIVQTPSIALAFTIYSAILVFGCAILRSRTKLETLPTLLSLSKYSFLIILFSHDSKREALIVMALFIIYEWFHDKRKNSKVMIGLGFSLLMLSVGLYIAPLF